MALGVAVALAMETMTMPKQQTEITIVPKMAVAMERRVIKIKPRIKVKAS
jgi:hypothetical protein